MRFVLVAANQLFNIIALARDDAHCGFIVSLAISFFKSGIKQVLHPFCMGLVDTENQCFLFAVRVQLIGQLVADDLVKSGCDNATVERLDIEGQLVFQLRYINLASLSVDNADRLTFFIMYTVLSELGFIANRWFVIDKPVVGNGLPITVGKYRFTKNFAGVLGWRGRKANTAGIEIIEYATVLRKVLAVISYGQLTFGHLLVERVTPVGFVDDDAVEFPYGWRIVRAENTADHRLYGSHLDAGFRFCSHIAQFFDVVDLPQGVVLLKSGVVERVNGLLAEGTAVDQKQNALEAFSLEEAVHKTNDGAGFTCARGHGQQAVALAVSQCLLYGLDSFLLVVT